MFRRLGFSEEKDETIYTSEVQLRGFDELACLGVGRLALSPSCADPYTNWVPFAAVLCTS